MNGDKKLLRARLKEAEKNISAEIRERENEFIFSSLISLSEFKNAKNIFTYCSTESEPDTLKFIDFALKMGKNISVPKITGNGMMAAAVIKHSDELIPDKFGILAPKNAAILMQKNDIDLVIVPGASFDRSGKRLGRGGGYYDRFLSETDAYSVGLIWSPLFLEHIPTEEHDIPVNCVISGKEIARLS